MVRRIGAFVAENPYFLVFLTGYTAFVGGIAWYSVPLSGVVGGGVLMAVAAYPFLRTGKS